MTEGKRARVLRGFPTSLISLATVIAFEHACGSDDDSSTTPPNDVPADQQTLLSALIPHLLLDRWP